MQSKEQQYQDVLTFWKTIKEFPVPKTDDDYELICSTIDSLKPQSNTLLIHLCVGYLNYLQELNENDNSSKRKLKDRKAKCRA